MMEERRVRPPPSDAPEAREDIAAGVAIATPSLLLASARGLAVRMSEGAAGAVVRLRAVPTRSGGGSGGHDYGGYAYVTLADPAVGGVAVSGKLPTSLVARVEWGSETLFTGVVDYQSRRGGLEVQFVVGSVEGLAGGARAPSKEALRASWRGEIERARPDPETALAGARPRVAVVAPATGVAVTDIRAQLREEERSLDLLVREVSMGQPEAVAKAIQDMAPRADLVVLTRGGGADVDALDCDVVIRAIATCPVPTIVAVGHATDTLVLEQVASRSFPTPTAAGVWLRAALERKRAKSTDAATSQAVARQGDLARTNADLVVTVGRLQTEAAELRAQVKALAEAGSAALGERRAEVARLEATLRLWRWVAVGAGVAAVVAVALLAVGV